MIERALIVLTLGVLLAFLAGAARIYSRVMRQRATRSLQQERAGRIGERAEVFYFYTQDCVQCRTLQWPALEQLTERLPTHVVVHRIDALENRGLANRFGVLTVPTTVVVDRAGCVHALNYGYADIGRLEQQVRGAWDGA